jgi:tetratricopeptide (TPR) repeat protein
VAGGFQLEYLRVYLLSSVLLSGCLSSDGPNRTRLLSNFEVANTVEDVAGFETLEQHRWGGWLRVPIERKLHRRFKEACVLEEAGLLEDAIETLVRLQEKNPDSACVLEARGALYAALGYQRAAAGDFQRAIWIQPNRAETWGALGRMQYELDLSHQALAALERAGELGLDSFEYHLTLARTYRALARRGKAAVHYSRSIEHHVSPTVELYVEAATLATEGGNDALEAEAFEQALHLIDRALELETNSCQAWFVRALLLEAADEPTQAIAAYLRALEIDPEHLAAWTSLALFSLRRGDTETSSEAARRALELETDPRRRRSLERLLLKRPVREKG